jgi:hypothetical protein
MRKITPVFLFAAIIAPLLAEPQNRKIETPEEREFVAKFDDLTRQFQERLVALGGKADVAPLGGGENAGTESGSETKNAGGTECKPDDVECKLQDPEGYGLTSSGGPGLGYYIYNNIKFEYWWLNTDDEKKACGELKSIDDLCSDPVNAALSKNICPNGAISNNAAKKYIDLSLKCRGYNIFGQDNPKTKTKENAEKSCWHSNGIYSDGKCECPEFSPNLKDAPFGGPFCDLKDLAGSDPAGIKEQITKRKREIEALKK